MTTLEKKIQKKVDEINNLISLASNSESDNAYDGNLMVTDTSSTWEEPAIYKPIVFRNGVLYIEYFEPYSNRTKKDKILKRNLEFDGYGTLLDIAKIYRRALKKENIKYAGGGKVKPFEYKENNATIMFNGTKADVKEMYLDYVNNFLSVSRFAEYYNISERQANSIIESGRKYAKEDGYYARGGKVFYKDLFEDYENQPAELSEIVESYIEKFETDDYDDYNDTKKFLQEVESIGYTFDYGLDNEPYALRKKDVKLNQVIGYEDMYIKNDNFADGGVTENYVSRRNLNTITIKKGNQKLTYKISDVLNGAYKLESGAKIEDIAFYVPKRSVVKVQLKSGQDFKPANGYWIKDGAKPIHITKFYEGGVMSKLLTRKKDQPKVETTNEDIDLNEDSRIRVRPTSFVRKNKEADWMMKNNSSKEARAYAGGGKITIRNIDWANADNKKLGVWLLTSVDGNKILQDSKDANELEENVMDYYKKRGSVARMKWDEDEDEGLSWVTFNDLFLEVKSLGSEKKYKGGGKVKVGDFVKQKGSNVRLKVTDVGNDWRSGYDYITFYNDVTNRTTTLVDWSDYVIDNKKMITGGKVTFSEKAKAIAKNFEGKRVEPKYQKEYGKVYDSKEAKEVGNKIAGSQKAKYDAKLEKGSEVKKKAGNPKMKATIDLAKKIRKDGEKWTDAVKRASLQLK
jgi:hypothetical protein